MSTHRFRSAVEGADLEAALATLADDVVFHSPVAFTPFAGREAVSGVLRLVFATFEDFRYESEVADETTTMLIFRTRVGDKEIQGLDLMHHNDDGLIDEFTVMVRPLSGAIALAEAMGPKVIAAGLK